MERTEKTWFYWKLGESWPKRLEACYRNNLSFLWVTSLCTSQAGRNEILIVRLSYADQIRQGSDDWSCAGRRRCYCSLNSCCLHCSSVAVFQKSVARNAKCSNMSHTISIGTYFFWFICTLPFETSGTASCGTTGIIFFMIQIFISIYHCIFNAFFEFSMNQCPVIVNFLTQIWFYPLNIYFHFQYCCFPVILNCSIVGSCIITIQMKSLTISFHCVNLFYMFHF